ncbi:hypothetical protein P7B02_08510 [Caulobacter segnis]|uniref:hypothetical protein n=1 Tax=Caulobacter segnis TaxID=88688 RepID=UPI00240F8FD8|nr:hypothetical protein [Caulobacter segnis]MDG2521582.1 hypothetical protein [Caulobacter segnis]
MDTLNLIVDGFWIAALAIMAGAARQAYARILPDTQVPMQFGFDGQPTWRAPKLFALAFQPAAATVVWLSMVAVGRTGSDEAALMMLGMKALFAPLLALVNLWWLRKVIKILGDEGQLRG